MGSTIRWSAQELVYWCIVACTLLCAQTDSSAVQLNGNNIDEVLRNNELVFVNFYADWCRFSQMLAPIFDDTSNKVKADFPEEGKVVLGKVDCDREGGIAAKYHVSKYPTLKVFRYGSLVKREYRGQRSADALSNYIRDAIKDPVRRITTIEELENLDNALAVTQSPKNNKRRNRKKRHIIGYFDSETSPDFATFKKIASMLRDDCEFVAALGTVSEKERVTGNRVVYRPPDPDATDIPYTGDLNSFNLLHTWAMDKCVPLVREITFENAEELTEEGLPFVILFHHLDDTTTPEKFRKIVARDLLAEKNGVNFLTADGNKFSHPLYHLGKSTSDLPVLAIDSFRHMYVWKKDPRENLETGENLKQFIADLHSGKLHREFHHGPDKTTEQPKIGGDGAGTGGSNDATGGAGKVHGDAHVQQQIILSSNGMTVQIVRVVEIGNPRQLNLHNQLQQLTNELNEKKPEGDQKPDGEKPWEESENKTPDAVMETPAPGTEKAGDVAGSKNDQLKDGEHKVIHEKKIAVKLTPDTLPGEEPQRVDDQELMLDEHGQPMRDPPPITDMPPLHGQPREDRRPGPHDPLQDAPHGQPIMDQHMRQGQRVPRQQHGQPVRRHPTQQKQPPKSIFRHLQPSKSKYTILRDEF